jgi:O-acetyl-ADP-ribose deacetylase (regulator of RNase III)
LINYVKGDATKPQGDGPKFIIHCCNNIGLWGAGFVLAVSRRWSQPEHYFSMFEALPLGLVQFVKVTDDITVVNMVGQDGVGRRPDGSPPIDYNAIERCLEKVASACADPAYRGPYKSVSVHAPRFGAGLAGGDWDRIEEIINHTLIEKEIPVTVYDFEG